MKILIVEDDEKKKSKLKSFIKNYETSIHISDASSYQSGLRTIIADDFDLILLDMTMPRFDISPSEDGGRPQPYAGKKILHQMQRRQIKTPVIIVTQFDVFGESTDQKTLEEINTELKSEYGEFYLGSVYYNTTQDEWMKKLSSMIKKVQP